MIGLRDLVFKVDCEFLLRGALRDFLASVRGWESMVSVLAGYSWLSRLVFGRCGYDLNT